MEALLSDASNDNPAMASTQLGKAAAESELAAISAENAKMKAMLEIGIQGAR
ncbi:MAG: hypothetical protein R3D29_12535 [Nitratireductor sp.]